MHKTSLVAMLIMLTTMTITTSACGDDDSQPARPNTEQGNNDPHDNDQDDPNANQGNDDTNQGNDSTQMQPADSSLAVTTFVGGDISMLPKYEQQHAAYADQNGTAIGDMLTFLKQQGWNTMRVRLFVDPSHDSDKAVCQDLSYVTSLAKRIKQAGLKLMLDFHYSDTWADPAKQWTPAAWLQLSDQQLQSQIYDYTRDCLSELVAAGATPDFIQTGNEISYGMLWGAAGTSANRCYTNSAAANWDRFIALLKQAGRACREVCPQAKIIIHSERTPKPAVLTDFFDRMQTAQLDYDVIGLSYYPYFHGNLSVLDTALRQLEAKNYGKQIQIVETGYSSQYPIGDIDCSADYPYSEQGQLKFVNDLIDMLAQHPQVNGLSWWYPEANAKGCTGNLSTGWYNAGLFSNNTGRALKALYALQNFK